jgi:sporulation related protein
MASEEESAIGPALVQRRIFLSFCATVLLGVLLCAVYLARRATWLAPRTTTSASSARTHGAVSPEPQLKLRPAAPFRAVLPLDTKSAAQVPAPAASVSRSGKLSPGDTYLQVAALDRGMSEALVEALRRKGFQAEAASGPTEDIFRVVVGPAKDAAAVARMKQDLQAAGFTSFERKIPKSAPNESVAKHPAAYLTAPASSPSTDGDTPAAAITR